MVLYRGFISLKDTILTWNKDKSVLVLCFGDKTLNPKNEGINFEKLIWKTGHIFSGLIGVNEKNN